MKGGILVAEMPDNMQTGQSMLISKNKQYITIKVIKINVFDAIAEIGAPHVWCDI